MCPVIYNVGVQADGELVAFYTDWTDPIARATEVAKAAGLTVEDVFLIPDEEMVYHLFDGRVWDTGLLKKEAGDDDV